jgi:UDP-N-acetylmuramoyl-L-alanyl-D-glutamate--2,6-diaminopimelate ligase
MDRIVSLRKILATVPTLLDVGGFPDLNIHSVTADSRKVIPGSLFVACAGEIVDGHDFIDKAIANGAVAIVGAMDILQKTAPYIRVKNSRQALAFLASAFYDHPSRKMLMIGITGTDGKTTTANLVYSILLSAGYKAGMISTVNAVIGNMILDTGFHVTTPDAPDIQHYLYLMREAGITHVVLETTSHGLAQYRVEACNFDIGIITNITHEHLDYHHSFENYREAKARLFKSLSENSSKNEGNDVQLAILNRDDPSYDYLKEISLVKTVSYGLGENADVTAINVAQGDNGLSFDVMMNGIAQGEFATKLVGCFNISNSLAAITAGIVGLGIDPSIVMDGITRMEGVPGRMERIACGQKFIAIVDFAHTPNALFSAIKTARQLSKGKVIAIFGSAGLRDREKRKLMAEVSIEQADISIFTAEDPRTESLDGILMDMETGAKSKSIGVEKKYWCIPDRREAIRFGVNMAQEGDVVICCGKGHEQSMCFGTTEFVWDDRVAMRAALTEMMGLKGPEMPFLPTQERKN